MMVLAADLMKLNLGQHIGVASLMEEVRSHY